VTVPVNVEKPTKKAFAAAVPLAHQLAQVEFAALAHFGRAGVAQMRVVRPHDDLGGSAALARQVHV